MKSFKLFMAAVFAVVLVSCSSDDSDRYEYSKANLTGSYDLVYFKEVVKETVQVSGFDVVTTTTSVGDTFSVEYVFGSDNILTVNGNFRVLRTKKQGDQTTEESEIIIIDNEKIGYTVNEATSELSLENLTYKVSNFSPGGFTLKSSLKTTTSDGTEIEQTQELRFTK